MLRWWILTRKSNESFLESPIEELRVTMCSLYHLSEECAGGWRAILLVL
jgi:hypothetical protein